MTEQMNVPKLRFGEFDTFWDTVPLSKLTTKISDGIHSTPNYDESGDFFFVNGNNLKNGAILLDEKTKRVSAEEAKKHHRQIDQNTILMSINGTIGNLAFYQGEPIMLGKSASYINIDPRTADKLFVSNFLQREATKYYFDTELTGSTIKNLSLKAIKNTPVASPTLPEQQKIASFLSKVDEKIELLAEKKDKLTEYKKGVMQQLFNGKWEEQDGQLTFIPPTLRFKADDGSEFPDWVEKTLGDVSEPPSYGLNSAATKYDGVNKYIRITDIDEDDRSFSPSPLTSPEEVNDAYLLEEGDIVFARTGASVGKSYLYNKDDGRLMFAGFLIKFSVSKANPKFISYQMTTSQYEHWVKVMSVRSGQPGINAQEYSTYSLNIPCTEEQEQIANFLSALDHKIDLLSSELEKAKEWKKGLLQQMFV
ncbi:restriction endonuclease subunit S [Vibrio parahaemolyticus]|uniref:restriction endonuclease subunit S n=2 Tax=Vibrio parahaemolyticus TaxID=670 RepID=UPI0006AD070B|nr:restriction endonuclease subunit S [Vibrio parahaemolyticus]EJG0622172.1 restriction endonuclease subunit S [Vibrio parahaemolyticus]EJG0640466.1 restriction endonuclease subunit S [Vibrio parahaemolyticus]EJG0687376.1 restriction endonuclease subunit S [Vibrio parahaemolyticus]EJG0701832.1 restriction endonuclease subunit S [Vibrio parahaemolyticus]EJG0730413.1 restriction endonuclease subunit S [Vibrio parahaemolyticus]